MKGFQQSLLIKYPQLYITLINFIQRVTEINASQLIL